MTNRRKGSWQVGNKWQLHKGSYLLWSLVQPGENPPWPWCATSAACAQPGGDLLLTVVNCDGGRCHAPHPQQKKNPKGNWYEAEPRLALWGRGSGTSWDFLLTLCIPTAKGEILQAVKLCHLCDLSERFGEGDMCDTSVAVVWLKMVSCETGPSAYKFHKRKKKKVLTSKLDASLDSPGNHKITFLKTAKYAISTPLSSFKETRVAGKG